MEIFNDIKTSFVIDGNIYDIYPYSLSTGQTYFELDEYLNCFLRDKGYKRILFFDPIHGFYNRFEELDIISLLEECGCSVSECIERRDNYLGNIVCCKLGDEENTSMVKWAGELIDTAVTSNVLVAFVMSFASRFCELPDNLLEDERLSFLNLMYGSLNTHSVMEQGILKKSAVYMIADKINDIPSWFFINNPYFKNISIPMPDIETRENFLNYIRDDFDGISSNDNEDTIKKLVHITEGMKCVEINALANLCEKEQFEIKAIDDAVSLYKYGIKENPWESIPRDTLNNAEKIIKERVKGQDVAIIRAVDVIKRAASGMSGLQHSSAKSRPRGIMFFAGPTGVGKTELAKSIAELLFGDEDNCIRFDMSEFAQPQSDQKLFGAPPGYVGYESGGQLTNAVRNNPFSILLFDEIEKAHPSIWDKFLQILDDGRMTDGQGNTVYFSETIIIFTSNLGIHVNDEYGRKVKKVSADDSYEILEEKVLSGIKEYFNSQQGKPEILNRIGNNIIVFKYISRDAAREILRKQLENLKAFMLREKRVEVNFDDIFERLLEVALVNIENGGRGVGNIVEEYIINPMARILYELNNSDEIKIRITGFSKENGLAEISYKIN
jgi:ATP-dependent Clp protease ATP-binding subunit ClpA